MRKERNILQMKGQDKPPEKTLRNLPDKAFKVIGIEILTKVIKRIDEHSKKFNKDREI